MKKWTILFCLLSGIPFATLAGESAMFEGRYECTGKELGTDTSFTAIMTIEKTGETYAIQSRFEKDTYIGIGIVDNQNNSLSAAFLNPTKMKESGVIIFHARNADKLDATWTYLEQKEIANAVCTRKG